MIKIVIIYALLLNISLYLSLTEESCIENKNKISFEIKKEIISKLNNTYTFFFQSKKYSELIIIAEKNDNTKKIFTNTFSFEYIKDIEFKISKYTSTPKQIYDKLYEIIERNDIVIEEEYERLKISLFIEKDSNNLFKKEKIFRIFEQKEKIDKDLIKQILELQNEIDSLKEQIVELNKFKSYIVSKNTINNLDSYIVGNNFDYIYLLKNWINPFNEIEANLLYKMSRDGPESYTFHKLCDNKGATLSLFSLKEGYKIGFYISESFDSNSGWKNDEKCFIFNLNQKKQYKRKLNLYCGIYYNKFDCGPSVNRLGCRDDSNLKFLYILSNLNEIFENGNKILPIKTEITQYEVQEVEIFQIVEL